MTGGNTRLFVITGPGRSGTSLLSVMANEWMTDTVAFNELVDSSDPDGMVQFMLKQKSSLACGLPVPDRYQHDGKARTTNTWRDGSEVALKRVEKKLSGNPALISKVVVGGLENLWRYRNVGFRSLVVIRDPVWTVAAWGVGNHRDMNVYGVMDDAMHPYWHNRERPWKDSDSAEERRARIWNRDVKVVLKAIEQMTDDDLVICLYEDLVNSPRAEASRLARWMGVELFPEEQCDLWIRNMNDDNRYRHDCNMEKVREAVHHICDARFSFGYK